jgi:GDP-4-dehydro-6-deoxy-D-mannose reductase
MTRPPRLFVTGITGFIARYVVPEFLAAAWHVQGLHRRSEVAAPWPIAARICDLTGDLAAIREALQESRPDVVLHLAAMIPHDRVTAAWSWIEANGRATEQLLDACRACDPMPRVVVVSSGALYGSLPAGAEPFTEASLPRPSTTYGISKLLVESLAMRAGSAWGLPVVRVRLFNVTGPGEPPHLAIGAFARQIVDIEQGRSAPTLQVSDLTTERDFLDVRDAARGVFLAARAGEPGEVYNLCSGQAVAMSRVVDTLIELARYSGDIQLNCRATVPDPIRSQCGSAARLSALTGWQPGRPLRETLNDVLTACRAEDQAARAARV